MVLAWNEAPSIQLSAAERHWQNKTCTISQTPRFRRGGSCHSGRVRNVVVPVNSLNVEAPNRVARDRDTATSPQVSDGVTRVNPEGAPGASGRGSPHTLQHVFRSRSRRMSTPAGLLSQDPRLSCAQPSTSACVSVGVYNPAAGGWQDMSAAAARRARTPARDAAFAAVRRADDIFRVVVTPDCLIGPGDWARATSAGAWPRARRDVEVEAWHTGHPHRVALDKDASDGRARDFLWDGDLSTNGRAVSFRRSASSSGSVGLLSRQHRLIALPTQRTVDGRCQTSLWGASHENLYTGPLVGPGSYHARSSDFGEKRVYRSHLNSAALRSNRLGLPAGTVTPRPAAGDSGRGMRRG